MQEGDFDQARRLLRLKKADLSSSHSLLDTFIRVYPALSQKLLIAQWSHCGHLTAGKICFMFGLV